MLNAAVIENSVVVNVIYTDQANMEAFRSAGMELIDAAPLGLTMGDEREKGIWYRIVDGVKTALTEAIEDPVEPEVQP